MSLGCWTERHSPLVAQRGSAASDPDPTRVGGSETCCRTLCEGHHSCPRARVLVHVSSCTRCLIRLHIRTTDKLCVIPVATSNSTSSRIGSETVSGIRWTSCNMMFLLPNLPARQQLGFEPLTAGLSLCERVRMGITAEFHRGKGLSPWRRHLDERGGG